MKGWLEISQIQLDTFKNIREFCGTVRPGWNIKLDLWLQSLSLFQFGGGYFMFTMGIYTIWALGEQQAIKNCHQMYRTQVFN
jgi:hypothetical protein